MGKTGALGSFEEMVLLAVLHQGSHAYSVSIRRELADRSGSEITMGAVYATLDRLEDKGLVVSRPDEVGGAGPGRPRNYYSVQPAGVAALDETRRIRKAMWRGIHLHGADGGVAG